MNSDDATENASNVSRFLKNKAMTSGRAAVQSTTNIRLKLIEFGSVDILDEKESIVDFWTNHKRRYPEIFHLSEIVFAVSSTEVEVERLFSTFNFVLTKLKTGLKDENLEKIIFLKSNHDLF